MNRRDVEIRARALDERELTTDEFDRLLRRVLADAEELEERATLIRWFMRRYPTVRERLAYARRKFRQLTESPLRAPLDADANKLGRPGG